VLVVLHALRQTMDRMEQLERTVELEEEVLDRHFLREHLEQAQQEHVFQAEVEVVVLLVEQVEQRLQMVDEVVLPGVLHLEVEQETQEEQEQVDNMVQTEVLEQEERLS
jgi:hypothetical protein